MFSGTSFFFPMQAVESLECYRNQRPQHLQEEH